MQATSLVFRWSSALGVCALLTFGACKSSSPKEGASAPPADKTANKVSITDEATATADVVAVNRTARVITLQREDGAMLNVHATDAVRNFDQIQVGNKLRVHYKQNLTAAHAVGATSADNGQVAVAAARAPVGDKPAAGIGVGVRVVVKVESIDASHDIVVASLASGELITHRVATPEGRKFVETLKVGDKVELTYSEALALSIDQM